MESATPQSARHRLVTVFGGTGFLGRRVARRLLERGVEVRIASRRPERARSLFASAPSPEARPVDIRDEAAVADAVASAGAVVNAVSLYLEHGGATFDAIHVEGAARVARCARNAGATVLVHLSGIGADASSTSSYIRARGRGEYVVLEAFPQASVVRPSAMVGADDAFLTTLVSLVRKLPVYPMFGRGEMRLQPVLVEDVSEAVARLADGSRDRIERCYEFGGPCIYTYRELIETVAKLIETRVRTVLVPFTLWQCLGFVGELLPNAPLTRHQIELVRHDNVASKGLPDLASLDIAPEAIDDVVRQIVGARN